MKPGRVTAWLAACFLCLPCAAQSPAPADCPAAQDVQGRHLHGFWSAELAGLGRATLLLEQSRTYAEGLSGAISRDGEKAFLAGDVDDGQFTLEESADGTHISASWSGEIAERSCGREIKGIWKDAQSRQERGFVLRKMPP